MARHVTSRTKASKTAKATAKPTNRAAHSTKKSASIRPMVSTTQFRNRLPGLRTWNLVLAGLHGLQGIAILLLSTGRMFPVTTSYLATDPLQTAAQGKPVLTLATQHLFDINLAYLVAAFFFLSAIAHLVIATVYRPHYEADLARSQNKARWFEYALSASTMMVAIGLLVGVQDGSTLVALFGLTAVMNLCGLIMETHNRPDKPVNWLSFVVGGIAGLLPWVIIAIYLLGGAIYGSSAPAFVYWIFVSMFLLFASFALNMALQYRRTRRWADYLYGEQIYMVLSLVAKSLLAWQVFAGALRP